AQTPNAASNNLFKDRRLWRYSAVFAGRPLAMRANAPRPGEQAILRRTLSTDLTIPHPIDSIRSQRRLLESDRVLVPFVNLIEQRFQLRIDLRIVNKHSILSPEEEVTLVFQCVTVFGDADVDVVLAHLTRAQSGGPVGAVKSETGRQFNSDGILFGPWVMEIDRMLALTGWKQRGEPVMEETRLQEQPFARALSIARHLDMVCIGEGLNGIDGVFDFDVGKLGRAH